MSFLDNPGQWDEGHQMNDYAMMLQENPIATSNQFGAFEELDFDESEFPELKEKEEVEEKRSKLHRFRRAKKDSTTIGKLKKIVEEASDERYFSEDDILRVAGELDAEHVNSTMEIRLPDSLVPCLGEATALPRLTSQAWRNTAASPSLQRQRPQLGDNNFCKEFKDRGQRQRTCAEDECGCDDDTTDDEKRLDQNMLDEMLNQEMSAIDAEREEEDKGRGDDPHAMLFEDTRQSNEGEDILAQMQGHAAGSYTHIPAVVDSGASDHCINRSTVPEVPIMPSPGSRRGQVYSAAGGKGIDNEGEQCLPLVTSDGSSAPLVFQVAAVRKPLCSVARLCDRGNRITFGRSGGVVQNLRNGKCTRFKREGSIYVMDFYMDPESPFQRPGR